MAFVTDLIKQAFTTDGSGNVALRTTIEGDQNLNGGYITNEQTTTNMMSKGTVYRFDGVDDVIRFGDSANFTLPDDAVFLMAKIAPSTLTSVQAFIGKDDALNREYHFHVRTDGTLRVNLFDSGAATNFSAFDSPAGTISALTAYSASFTWDGTTGQLYVNSQPVTTTKSDTGTGFSSFSDTTSDIAIGALDNSSLSFGGEIAEAMTGNFIPSSDEIKDLVSGNVPFNLQGASQTALTSGTLTVGKRYKIDTFAAGDDFTNVATVLSGTINTDGCIFICKATTPTDWSNGSSLRAIGINFHVTQDSISETYWSDVSGNNNDGAVTGATVLNQPDGKAFKNIVLSPVAQDATPKEGEVIYNSATNKLNFWNGSAWEVVTSS